MMLSIEELYVIVCRQPGAKQTAEIAVEDIVSSVRWDNESGGYHKRTSYYNLYANVDYEWAKNNIDCSGRHSKGHNTAKICIVKSHNMNSLVHKEGYKYLCECAGEKPQAINRVNTSIPCTKAILIHLKSGEIKRGDLREYLLKEGYQATTICIALNKMMKDGRIVGKGSSNSKNQIISIALE